MSKPRIGSGGIAAQMVAAGVKQWDEVVINDLSVDLLTKAEWLAVMNRGDAPPAEVRCRVTAIGQSAVMLRRIGVRGRAADEFAHNGAWGPVDAKGQDGARGQR